MINVASWLGIAAVALGLVFVGVMLAMAANAPPAAAAAGPGPIPPPGAAVARFAAWMPWLITLMLVSALTLFGGYVTQLVGVGMCMSVPPGTGLRPYAVAALWLVIMSNVLLILASMNSDPEASGRTFAQSLGRAGAVEPKVMGLIAVGSVVAMIGWLMLTRFFAGVGKTYDSPQLLAVNRRLAILIVAFYLLGVALQAWLSFDDSGLARGQSATQASMLVNLLGAALGLWWMGRAARLARAAITLRGKTFAHAVAPASPLLPAVGAPGGGPSPRAEPAAEGEPGFLP